MTSAWWTSRSIMAAATTSSPKTSAPPAEWLVGGDDEAGSFVAGGDQLEEQVGGLGFEGDVSDLVDHEQGDAGELVQFGLQPAVVVGRAETGDPRGGGGEAHPASGLAGSAGKPGGALACAGA